MNTIVRITLTTLALVATGCSASVGPYISAVHVEDGRLRARRCTGKVTVFAGIVGASESDCKVVEYDLEESE